MWAVVDTNVLVSALVNPSGTPGRLVDEIRTLAPTPVRREKTPDGRSRAEGEQSAGTINFTGRLSPDLATAFMMKVSSLRQSRTNANTACRSA
jgi:hypothetical protein